jgi:TonB family protein
VGCGKKAVEEKPVAVMGTDTLTRAEFSKLSADTVHGPSELRRIVLQWALAIQEPVPEDTAQYRQTVDELAEQLSLRSDRQWITAEAGLLLRAVRAIIAWMDDVEDPSTVGNFVDSIASSVVVLGDTAEQKEPEPDDASPAATDDTEDVDKKALLSALVKRVFDLSPALAGIIIDFATEGTDWEEDVGVADDLVKGLVYDSTVEAELKKLRREKAQVAARIRHLPRPKPRPIRRDNWREALKHRPRGSIVDSINKHLPYLQSIYKKKLRLHTDMAGKVVVSFRIAASGKVIRAKVTKSGIPYKAFLEPFLAHVKTIRFKQIPEDVGPTSVEFPFEFKAEE